MHHQTTPTRRKEVDQQRVPREEAEGSKGLGRSRALILYPASTLSPVSPAPGWLRDVLQTPTPKTGGEDHPITLLLTLRQSYPPVHLFTHVECLYGVAIQPQGPL